MEKIKLLDKRTIELPKYLCEKFRLEKGTEFDLFFDNDTIYLKRVFKSIKEKSFREIANPFREMAERQKLKREDVAEEIRQLRKRR